VGKEMQYQNELSKLREMVKGNAELAAAVERKIELLESEGFLNGR
jgi:hypothetical protein